MWRLRKQTQPFPLLEILGVFWLTNAAVLRRVSCSLVPSVLCQRGCTAGEAVCAGTEITPPRLDALPWYFR